ncbi:MAG: alpha/beta fold hydrolase [Pseudomonadota bacterium]
MAHRFGQCEIDPDRRVLRKDGYDVHVEPQVFNLLLALIHAGGAVVTKDALVETVWRGLHVSDATISSRINAARKAVGDTGKAQAVIRTVPKVGFQLVSPVERSDSAPKDAAASARKIRYTTSADQEPIAYAIHGHGPPLVRVGHWLSHLEMDLESPVWRPLLDRLGAAFTLYRYDQRATGLSTRSVANLTLGAFVDDLKAVMDANNLAQAPVFAASQAVPVALRFARLHPDRVSKLVLYGGYAVGRYHRDIAAGDVDEDTVLSLIRAGWGNEKSAFFKAFASLFMPGATSAQIENFVDIQARSVTAENAVLLRQAIDRFNVLEDLPHIKQPILVVHPQGDGVHPMSQGQLLASRLPNAEFRMLDSANHVPLPQDPAWADLISSILTFCR